MNQSSQKAVSLKIDVDHLCLRGPTQVIGKSVSRQEDRRILTGQGHYVDDSRVPGALYARFVRSPIAHGRLLSVDTQAAKSSPGVHGVFTGTDLNLRKIVPPLTTPGVVRLGRPILPTDSSDRFSGEAYAVVVAESQYEAEDAAQAAAAALTQRI
ncbi:hypothetical protein RQN9TF_32945 (plasmid) [Rhodococcus qingshengii]|uniref:hypothetical protein n=1 Tax=Rhodococcus TaxID=1827 RepID=UPI000F617289|nr:MULTISPECIES: hypothetical protein [Rhodococcus]AZI66045.1 hypothetical protein EHW12_33995 [Rhodococcus sp. NJ-530]BDQ24070.1 hypothetical protein RQN9TF_32945 [Rhodococcus qingshengii]